MSPKISKNYESLIVDLTSLVDELENGDKSLDEAMIIFEQGLELTQTAQKKLQAAEQKVQILTDANGKPSIGKSTKENSEK